jgi:hypothetical protein
VAARNPVPIATAVTLPANVSGGTKTTYNADNDFAVAYSLPVYQNRLIVEP